MTDTIICHTDAARNKEHKVAGLAWIFSNPDSTKISRGSSLQTDVSSPLMAEVLSPRSPLARLRSPLQTYLAPLRFPRADHIHQLESPIDIALQYSIRCRFNYFF
ncbi:hypothetical protein F2Q69_00061969 [Brassica cretica]|uniref:Uncharacterized protein n=1 Tax=Brassica cretica TaxID=69181 RepID=A0A8S9RPS3_BRACR|nr:hypothetical protein F2Q69_00061969 [Brassica cretica]